MFQIFLNSISLLTHTHTRVNNFIIAIYSLITICNSPNIKHSTTVIRAKLSIEIENVKMFCTTVIVINEYMVYIGEHFLIRV